MAIVGIQETDKDNDSYEIQWGDTLSQIALNNNTTVEALAQLNGIKDPDRIRAGGSLIIPTQPRKKKEAAIPPQQVARQAAFEAAAQKYAAAPKEERRPPPPREDAAKIAQLEAERQEDPRWVKVPIEGGESVWRKLKLAKTTEYRDRNRNAIEDRDEGIYLPRDFEEPGRKEPTINIFGKDIPVSSLKSGDEGMIKRIDEKDLDDTTINIFGRDVKVRSLKDEGMIRKPKPIEGGYAPLFESMLDERPAEEEETSWEKRHGFASPEVQATSLLSREEDKKELSSTAIPSPIKYVWGSLWGKGTGQTRTGEDVGEDVVQVTKDAKDNAIAAGRSHVHYEDYGETNRGLPVAALVGAAKDASGRKLSPKERQSLSSQRRKAYPKNPIGAARLVYDLFTDPKVKAALTIGGFSIRGDEGGEYLEDVFNFNTANSGDKDWYAFIRKVLSNSGLMPIDDNEGIKTRIELS